MKATKRVRVGAARKSGPSRHRSNFKMGDRVRILDIPEDLKDPGYDLKYDTAEHKFRTGELFRFCLGRVFTIYGFDRYGRAELHVDKSLACRKRGFSGWIWIEPEFLKLISGHRPKENVKS